MTALASLLAALALLPAGAAQPAPPSGLKVPAPRPVLTPAPIDPRLTDGLQAHLLEQAGGIGGALNTGACVEERKPRGADGNAFSACLDVSVVAPREPIARAVLRVNLGKVTLTAETWAKRPRKAGQTRDLYLVTAEVYELGAGSVLESAQILVYESAENDPGPHLAVGVPLDPSDAAVLKRFKELAARALRAVRTVEA